MASINDATHADDWAAGGIHKRDFRHDHSGPEEMPHRKKRGKANPRKKKGCPANEGGAHIYAWIEYHARWKDHPYGLTGESRWHESTWYEQQCIGCEHVHNRRYSWWEDATPDGIEVYESREARYPWYY